MNSEIKLTVVLPAYNEEENLKELIPAISGTLGKNCEIIVSDDASGDNTVLVAQSHGAKVIKSPYNMGNGAAVKRGIRAATNEIVVLMDADGQHVPAEIPKIVAGLTEGFDMVVGSRQACRQAWWRKIANEIYNVLASYVTGVKIYDLTSGFRVFKKSKAIKFLHLLPNTFSYPSTLTLAFIKAAYPVKFTAVEVLERKKGKSKINLINDGLRFLIIIIRISVFFSPLKVFLPVSLFFFISGISYYIYTFLNSHRFTNMGVLLLSSSVIIFMLGLISEQIAYLRTERTDGE